MKQPVKSTNIVIWVSKILRWALGALFIAWGFSEGPDWYTIVFGAIILLTGFLRPRRCIDGHCEISSRK